MFGGSAEPWAGSDEKQPKLADTTLLQFSKLLYIYMYMHGHSYRLFIYSTRQKKFPYRLN